MCSTTTNVLWLFVAASASAQTSYTFTTFAVRNSTYTDAIGINERGDVAGYYGVPSTSLFQGFLRVASGEITTISYPGQSVTTAYGLNRFRVVAGTYATGSSGGFLFRQGTYKSIIIEGQSTGVNDINDYGYYAGSYGSPRSAGFIASPSGQITTLNYPGAYATGVNWIKNDGAVIGTYQDNFGKLHTFVWSAKSGFMPVEIPGLPGASINDINASGAVVGGYFNGITDRGFVYQNGKFQIVLPPGFNDSIVGAINNKGQLVGSCSTPSTTQIGFIATPVAVSAPAADR
ncbi:MAG TPA: hypothetical protein VKT29_16725 [Terriglobales bacterium]|nr:hypothetical protein [Terriglobales bacterium]